MYVVFMSHPPPWLHSHGRSACHSSQTEYMITFSPACRWIAPWSTSTTGRDSRVGGGQIAVAWTPKNFLHACCSRLLRPLNAEQPRAPRSGAGDALSAGTSERLRLLWPGMNAALNVSGGKHTRVMKRVRVGQDRLWQRSGCAQTRDVVR